MQTHLGIHPIECFGQEVGGSHPRFQRAERVLHGGPADTHHIRVVIQTCLGSLQYHLVLPARHAPFPARSTLGLDWAHSTLERPVPMQCLAFLLRRHVPYQALSGRAFILVILGDITEGVPAELAFGLVTRCLWLGYISCYPGCITVPDLFTTVVAAISNHPQFFHPQCRLGLPGYLCQLPSVTTHVGDLVSDDHMVLGIYRGLYVVADNYTTPRLHQTGIRIG